MLNRVAKSTPVANTPSLRASLREGMCCATMLGVGEANLGAFGIHLLGTPFQIGSLATIPPLLGAIAQAFSVWLVERLKDRKRLIVSSVIGQALLWIPIAALVNFAPSISLTYVLIALACLYYIAGGISAPIWSSLIADLVPDDKRGQFFGFRNQLLGLITFFSLLIAGQILGIFERHQLSAWGFATIFLIACIARLASAYWLTKHDNPEVPLGKEYHFSFLAFIRRSPRSNFARFVMFASLMNFAVFVSSPFFSIYMLRDLRFSYLEFTGVTATATIMQFLTMQRWGSLSDRFGTKRILTVCSLSTALCPILWIFSSNFIYILFVQAYVGIVWAGYNLSASNFLYDAVTRPKRARCSAYQAIVVGILTFAGSLVGGYIATNLPESLHLHDLSGGPSSPYLILFLLSGVLRLIIALSFIKLFREVRAVEGIRHHELIFHMLYLRPLSGSTFQVLGPPSDPKLE